MNKIFYIILMISFINSFTYTQSCLPGGITFSTQQQIDDFASNYPGCTEILGYLNIAEATSGNITNLNGLSQITSVGAQLSIWYNDNLNSLSGLNNITYTGPSNYLFISNNPNLINLAGLSGLQTSGHIVIDNNPALTNLMGLDNLQTASSLVISGNTNLGNISNLSNLAVLNGRLAISGNSLLGSLSGLENLLSIGGRLEILMNFNLTTLVGIQNIDPATITSSNGSFEDLRIEDNNSLSECEVQSICDFLGLPNKTKNIQNNMTGCNSETEVETACLALPVTWLLPLKVNEIDNSHILSWSVAEQINNQKFIIEHSIDGKRFVEIAEINGDGNYLDEKKYEYTHKSPSVGKNYYKVKQVDFDGKYEYSNIVSIYFEREQISIFPNPSDGEVNFYSSTEAEVSIFNQFGQILDQHQINKGNNSLNLDQYQPGIYIFKTERGDIFRVVRSE